MHSSSVEKFATFLPQTSTPIWEQRPSKSALKERLLHEKLLTSSLILHVASQLSKQELLLSVQFCCSKSDLNLFCRCQVFMVCTEAFSISNYDWEYCSHGPQTWHFSLFPKSEQHLRMKPLHLSQGGSWLPSWFKARSLVPCDSRVWGGRERGKTSMYKIANLCSF